ncbi:MAG: multidrug efflux pump subunit AcrB [Cryomorphaceae bacterium]|jgi:multidrug efflux pump subunit AcrB
MIRWFTKNHVAANVLMLSILLYGGYLSYFKLGVEVEPAMTYPRVDIRIPYQGASPDAVESKIILPVEKALENLAGVKTIKAYAQKGNARIQVYVTDNVDINDMKIEIESRVESISTFPQNDDKPQVYILDTATWKSVISVAVYGDLSETALLQAARKVRDDLTALPGISKVRVIGDSSKEISIEVLPDKLDAYGLTFSDVVNGIRRDSVDVSAGAIKENGENITIRSNNKAFTGEKFKNLIIKSVKGSSIRVSDVAKVIDSFEEKEKESKYNGMPVLMIDVMRLDGENALKTADIVKDYIERANDTFPVGINLATWDDDSISLRGRLHTLFTNLLQGAVLVMILLGLFLRPKVAFWVTIGIPVSFAGAAISMYYTGVTANNMSLFGFIIVLGMVVDDAIVTGENIYAKVKSGNYEPMEAAVLGTQEVATPVTFGIITTIVAFLPLMYFDDNQIGNMAKQIPLVVIPVLIFSLIESKLILPSHLKNLKPVSPDSNIFARVQDSVANMMNVVIKKVYMPLLKLAISHRYAVFLLFIGILAITRGYQTNRMEFKFMPSTERYFLSARLEMKSGTERAVTEAKLNEILQGIDPLRGSFIDEGTGESLIGNVVSTLGGKLNWGSTGDHLAYVILEITPPSLRTTQDVKNSEIAAKWRELNGQIHGAERFVIRSERTQGKHSNRDEDGLEFELRGGNDDDKDKVIEQMRKWLSEKEIITSTWGKRPRGDRQLQVSLKPIAKQSQLSEDDVAKQIRTAFYGQQVQKIQRGEDEIKVMLKLPEEMRTSMHTLESLRINLKNGQTAPFSQFANITESTTPPRIDREDGSRVLDFGASVTSMSELIKFEPVIAEKMDELCLAYPSVSWAYQGEVADYKNSNSRTLILFILLMLALFALLAIPFKSFLQPIYVLTAVPFGVVGAVWGHAILGIDLSILSSFGMLALAGIVVNDSLVLVDYINTRRLEGIPFKDATMEAGARRFRPIILTSITTFVGLMPLMFETSIQAQFLIPMAISLGFGILFATAITLILIPCIYMIGEEIKEALSKVWKSVF